MSDLSDLKTSIIELAAKFREKTKRSVVNIGVFGDMGLGKSSFINTLLCLFEAEGERAFTATSSSTVSTSVKSYTVYTNGKEKINIFDCWGNEGTQWNTDLFVQYVDGYLDSVDKSQTGIKVQTNGKKNENYYLDCVIFFLQGYQCMPTIPTKHNYMPFVEECKKKEIKYSFVISFSGLETEDRKKLFLTNNKSVKESDYDELKSQCPEKPPASMSLNSAYRVIENYFTQIYGQPENFSYNPIINLERKFLQTATLQTVTHKFPLQYAGLAIVSALNIFSKRPTIPQPIPFDYIMFKDETIIDIIYSSFEVSKIGKGSINEFY